MSQLAEQTTRHAAFAEGVKTRYTNELLELLQDIEESMLGRLASYDLDGWTRSQAETRLAVFRKMTSAKYGVKIIDTLNSQLAEFAEYEAGFEARSLGNVVPKHTFLLPTETQIMTAVMLNPLSVSGPAGGKLLESYIKDFTEDQVERVSNAIRAGFAMGETTPAIVQRLKQEVLPINQRGLVGMARTALQHASAKARQATFEANSDIVTRIRIVATLDTRTSAICQSMDGREFPIDSGPRPPFHPNCRTTFVGVLDKRFAILEKGATRRERDPVTGEVGYVPANQSYFGWLKKQPKEIQDEIIGPTRGKLLRDGGLSSQRFSELGLTRQFKPRTIEEMRKIEPLAFLKAEI